ncbi:hypothetical protein ACQ31_gp087 [Salmonella phage STML-198]|uniref:Molybdenum ABC transporter n=2 Tax=Gelderlandvirus TaxID=1913653 RepID=K4I5Y3_9CAUD|nr:hypothetical protein ACQ31_gp087 [Salmonella phage STML-198]YP_009615503.1 hypothetical protein FDI73_gp017 [Salmonella phage Melville]AFU63970.1 hypothetical protein [Salmonella phage STML-198]ATN92991.1 hypothetical protein CPT_Melville_017 [Salmonella phage Melville]UPW42391.1 hypothetical protein EBPHNEJP_00093 [Salmonella phage CF-SP2]
MSDLFDLFEEDQSKNSEAFGNRRAEIRQELFVLALRHGVKLNDTFVEELSSIWLDPPPWAPWTE